MICDKTLILYSARKQMQKKPISPVKTNYLVGKTLKLSQKMYSTHEFAFAPESQEPERIIALLCWQMYPKNWPCFVLSSQCFFLLNGLECLTGTLESYPRKCCPSRD